MTLTTRQLLATLAQNPTLVSVLPIANNRPNWTLAVAVLLLAPLQLL